VLGLDLSAEIVKDEDKTIGTAGMIGDDETADAVDPVAVGVGFMRHHDHRVLEGLPGHDPVDRGAPMVEQVGALVAQDEVVAVILDRAAELVEGRDPVHLQRGLVGVGDGLVRFDQDHARGQAGNDLLELPSVGRLIPGGTARFATASGRNVGRTHVLRAPVMDTPQACTRLCHARPTLPFVLLE
jgi:hypothetical protein